jgi:tetratricopeptide (TPR) repeat protein
VILLDPARVGLLPNTAALTLLVASAVNIHHFVLDGAIWKLRNSRVGGVLIRHETPSAAAAVAPSGLGRRAVWAVAGVGCALALFQYAHKDVLVPLAVERGDWPAARAALTRLGWINEISDDAWQRLDVAQSGAPAVTGGAAPGPRTAHALAARGDWPAAARLYEELLVERPDNPALLLGAGRAWIELGEPDRAIPHLERLVALRPEDANGRAGLEFARRMAAGPIAP